MLRFLFVLLALVVRSFCFGQTIPLPIIQDGNWLILKNKQTIKLDRSVMYLDAFNEHGNAYFQTADGVGIMHETGEILIPPTFQSVSVFQNGHYALEREKQQLLMQITPTLKTEIQVDSTYAINTCWIVYKQDSSSFLLNLVSNRNIQLKNAEYPTPILHDYLVLHHPDSTFSFFSPHGELIDVSSNITASGSSEMASEIDSFLVPWWYHFQFNQDAFLYQSKKLKFYCDKSGRWDFSANSNLTWMDWANTKNELAVTENGITAVFDISTRTKRFSLKADYIYSYDKNYLFGLNTKEGLLDASGKIIFPAKYDYFSVSSTGVYVYNDGLTGLYSVDFKLILDCIYSRFSSDTEFYYTYSNVNQSGLVSRKTGKLILPAIYDKIIVERLKVRAWLNSNMTIFELSEDHEILQKIVLSDVVSVGKRQNLVFGYDYDMRLLQINWYSDTVSVFNGAKNWIKTNRIWGLTDGNNQIKVKARYQTPIFVQNAPVSLLKIPKQHPQDDIFYSMIDWQTGKVKSEYVLFSLDTTDFTRRNFARFAHQKGWGILKSDGKIVEMNYIDPTEEPFIRYCQEGTWPEKEFNKQELVPIVNQNLNSDFSMTCVTHPRTKLEICKQSFINGKWNFLDSMGNPLFEKPFLFADKFIHGTAIVKTESGWGVVNRDSFVVAPIYAYVERLSSFDDTVFKLTLNARLPFYTSTSFEQSPVQFQQISKHQEPLHLGIVAGKKSVFHSNGTVLELENSNPKLMSYGRIVQKVKKVFEIYDEHGRLIGESTMKPEQFLSPDFFTVESSSKLGLLSVNGDTILPSLYAKITRFNALFLAESSVSNLLVDESGKVVFDAKLKKIVVDSLSGNWLIWENGKGTIFESDNKKSKLKSELQPTAYFGNHIFFERNGSSQILNEVGENVPLLPGIKSFVFLDNGFFVAIDSENQEFIFNSKMQEIAPNFSGKKKVKQVSPGIFAFHIKRVWTVFSTESGEYITDLTQVADSFSDGLLLVSSGKSTAFFVDANFKRVFQPSFLAAKSFSYGFAPVKMQSGWTLINLKGEVQSLPSFNEIELIGKWVQIQPKNKYGLVSHSGKTIVNPEFEKITELKMDLLQVIQNGQIGYFSRRGNVIYPIQH